MFELNLLLNIYNIGNAELERVVMAVHFCAIHRNLILCELVYMTQWVLSESQD